MCPMMYAQSQNGAHDVTSGSCLQCPEIEKELSTAMGNSVCLTEDILALGEYHKMTCTSAKRFILWGIMNASVRARFLHRASGSMLRQLCSDAGNSVLIENNGVTPE